MKIVRGRFPFPMIAISYVLSCRLLWRRAEHWATSSEVSSEMRMPDEKKSLHDRAVAQALGLGDVRKLQHRVDLARIEERDSFVRLVLSQLHLRRRKRSDVAFGEVLKERSERDQVEILRALRNVMPYR
jgi:hypothetical protein